MQASVAAPAAKAPPGSASNEDVKDVIGEESDMTHTEELVFSPYVCQSISIGQPHPGTISEAALLSTAPLPQCTYPVDAFPIELIEQGKLTNLQLEGVLYACMQHQRILPNGARSGFFLGDGTGVGKGRQLAGIVLENLCRGRKKHLWFSVSNDLRVDAERDLRDIGCHVDVIDGCQQLEKEKAKGFGISSKTGVLYSTYSTLTSNYGHPTKSRLLQIVSWCGGDAFDGCILFDECHKAKHGELSDKNATASKVAQAVQKIQLLLPNARVVYCSATGVGGIEHMAYMSRLGLWGPSTAFQGFSEFLRTIKNRGMGAMEMLAIEMKLQGKYLSRGLSYVGAEFELDTVALTDSQRRVYDNAVAFWNVLIPCLERACKITRAQGEVFRVMWGFHQRFYRQLCMCMKVPFILTTVRDCLAAGQCAVVGLQTTGEASMERSNLADTKCDTLVSLCERILIDLVTLHFPTKIKMEKQASIPVTAADAVGTTNAFLQATYSVDPGDDIGDVVTLPDGTTESMVCLELKNALLAKIPTLELPPNPLDQLLNGLGGESQVAELTGRRHRLVWSDGHFLVKSRGLNLDQVNQDERQAFMRGQKLVAIISDAASTGISLHTDRRCQNQRRRVHITLELPWSADKAIQQLGRSHRSNQSCAPIYKLVTTDCGGETRFVAAVAKKMMTMGALTKGDRRAGSGQDLSGYHFETKYGFQAIRELLRCVCNGFYVEGVDIPALIQAHPSLISPLHMNGILVENLKSIGLYPPAQTVSVKLFLNRMLGLAPFHQNALFHYFEKTLQSVIAKAQQEGKYDEGYDDIKGRKAMLLSEADIGSNVTYSHILVDRGISWDEALSIFQNVSNELKAEFYISDQKYFGEYLYILMITGGRSCSVIRPNTGYMFLEPTKIDDMRDKYSTIAPEKAERGWKRIFGHCETRCIHTSGCKQGETCRVGIRKLQYHLLSGSLLPIWKLLEQLVTGQSDMHNSALRIVRITLTNSAKQKLVGVNFPPDLITTLQAMLITLAANTFTQVDPVTPIDVKTKERVSQAKRTMLTFFSPQVATKRQRPDEPAPTQAVGPSPPFTATTSSITPAKTTHNAKKTSPPTKQISVSSFFSAKVNVPPKEPEPLPPPTMCIDLVSSDDEA